ncbi:hypothetical protein MK805_09035 [Shimazuella sp. AN120528]|uniref:hypothetical protein n=1 Tax=Shimazuella soli TaxID=1892854 RepID=UPI001F117507|nr:hypothetical protein [Shimazuella soli]MCH5585114.1 hypothetical protein [Shimazuella soli]
MDTAMKLFLFWNVGMPLSAAVFTGLMAHRFKEHRQEFKLRLTLAGIAILFGFIFPWLAIASGLFWIKRIKQQHPAQHPAIPTTTPQQHPAQHPAIPPMPTTPPQLNPAQQMLFDRYVTMFKQNADKYYLELPKLWDADQTVFHMVRAYVDAMSSTAAPAPATPAPTAPATGQVDVTKKLILPQGD